MAGSGSGQSTSQNRGTAPVQCLRIVRSLKHCGRHGFMNATITAENRSSRIWGEVEQTPLPPESRERLTAGTPLSNTGRLRHGS